MSRLIVKNLPKSVTEAKLKELFSQKGLVTDVQLKYTKDGKFRRFCFIGYKTEEEAAVAKDYFDKSCIDTCRISVESCTSLGDPSKPKSWSKYAPDSSHNVLSKTGTDIKKEKTSENKIEEKIVKDKDGKKKKNKDNEEDAKVSKEKKKKNKEKDKNDEVKEALKKHKDDPLFMEFLENHAVSSKKLMDEDEDIKKEENDEYEENTDVNSDKEEESDNESDTKSKIANKVISDLEYMEALKKKDSSDKSTEVVVKTTKSHGAKEFFTVKVRGLGYAFKKKHLKQFFHPLKAKSIRLPPKIKGIAYVGFKTKHDMTKALQKNKSFLDGKQLFVIKYEKKENVDTDKIEEAKSNVKWKKQEDALKNEETIAESGRMFIRNLAYTTTEDDIRKLFEKYGLLTEVDLPVDKETRKPKGFGTITFLMPEHAMKAYSELDGSILNGRMLHILPGKAKPSLQDQLNQDGLTFKQKKDLQNKLTSQSSHNWNTLFLGQNAVAEAMAATYNTTKERILEDGSKGMSAAVKLALGETQLVQDTKKFLEENNVHLDAFNGPPEKRSRTVILIKNLPAGTLVQEIRQLFVKHGELGRVVMPPAGITALVEFLEPSEARKAFTRLAYTKFKHLPLYLEWAPENSFTTEPPKLDKNKLNEESKKKETIEVKETANTENNTEENEDDDEPEPDTTLFVKNINFSTTEDELKKYFSKCGDIHYATIATKKDPKNPANKLSMGYGFVRYKYKSDADRALKTLQMSVLEGKSLELKRSERTLMTDVKTAKKSTKTLGPVSSKILVRNVPFQATDKEIAELFKAFGELKAVRLPKKLIGAEKHRGFAFVEYYTKSEAKKAFKALCQSTHLYGRRLVLEWAQAEEGIEEIRKRTAKHFHQDIPIKKAKKAVLNAEEVNLPEEAE